ncbi:MAG: alcohol dehydrogenase catalytic domain-containing protein [Acidobacteriota bacterium]
MRALYFDGTLSLQEDYTTPAPAAGEALVRMVLSGVCNTDLEITRGYLSFRGVPGHEFVGIVERADDSPELLGQRVVGEINAACGQCHACAAGRPTHCPNRTTLGIAGRDGSFAEYLCLPVRNLHRVPDRVSDESAVFVEPLAAACEITEALQVRPTDSVVVLGDGKLGLLCAQVLQLTGCDLLAIGHHSASLALLGQRGIRTALADTGEARVTADIVVEATGEPEGYEAARRIVRPRGTIVLKSTYHGAIEANLTMVVVDEVTLVGSRCGPFAPALRLLSQNLVEVTPLVHARYRLANGAEALRHAEQNGVLKVLIEP